MDRSPKADLVFVPHFSAGGEDWRVGIEGVLDYTMSRRQHRTRAEVESLFSNKSLLEVRLMRAATRAKEIHNYSSVVMQSANKLHRRHDDKLKNDSRHRESVYRYGPGGSRPGHATDALPRLVGKKLEQHCCDGRKAAL